MGLRYWRKNSKLGSYKKANSNLPSKIAKEVKTKIVEKNQLILIFSH